MIETLFVLLLTILILGICLHHYTMKNTVANTMEVDIDSIKRAAEHALVATHSMSPVVALIEVVKCIQIVESLHDRYGYSAIRKITQVDTQELLRSVREQKNRIIRSIWEYLPQDKQGIVYHANFSPVPSE